MMTDAKTVLAHTDDTAPNLEQITVSEYLSQHPQTIWFKDSQRRSLYFIILPACLLVAATNGFDGSMMNGLQAVESWQVAFNYPEGPLLGILSASYPLGAICSTPFSPIIADRFGRRLSVFVGSLIMIAGAGLQAGANSFGMFVAARIIVGFGITIALASAPILISEIAHPNDRATITGLYNTTWCKLFRVLMSMTLVNMKAKAENINEDLGAILAAWTTYGTFRIPSSWGWRIPSLIQGLPASIQIIFIFMMPESPRWLLDKGREAEALTILANSHCGGNTSDPLVQVEFREIKHTLQIEKESAKRGVKQLWATAGNRKRMFIIVCVGLFAQWSGNGLVSYYLAKILTSIGITSRDRQNLINGILTIVNYCTSIIAAVIIPYIGRRMAFLVSTASMFVSFSSLTACLAVYNTNHSDAAAQGALGLIFIFYSCFNLAFNPLLYLYPVEILPYQIRAMGMSVLVFSNKLALFLNQFVNPIGLQDLGWKYYLVYVGWLLVELVIIYFFFPETKGYALEEIAVIFDGDQVIDRVRQASVASQSPKVISEKQELPK